MDITDFRTKTPVSYSINDLGKAPDYCNIPTNNIEIAFKEYEDFSEKNDLLKG